MTEQRKAPRNTTQDVKDNPGDFLALGMMMGVSEAIEFQEAQGQRELLHSETLPTPKQEDRVALEEFGVVFGDLVEGDPLFTYCTIPAGWTKRPTDHSMWSDLVDEQGRVRARIGYKAAFYDRWSQISVNRRYTSNIDYSDEYFPVHPKNYPKYSIVMDAGNVVKRFGPFEAVDDLEWFRDNRAEETAMAYLKENHPDYLSLTAYW